MGKPGARAVRGEGKGARIDTGVSVTVGAGPGDPAWLDEGQGPRRERRVTRGRCLAGAATQGALRAGQQGLA